MGQYHAFASLDAGEALHAHLMGEGLKLMEQGFGGYGGPTTGFALFIAPGGRWHGHRVAVVGDYAEPGDLPAGCRYADDPAALYQATRRDEATHIARAMCGEAFGIAYPDSELWAPLQIDRPRLRDLTSSLDDDRAFGALYVVDVDTGQYLDAMAFGTGRNLPAIALRQGGVMLATAILLAVSNGRGGGDFRCHDVPDAHLVGSWGGHRVVLGPRPDDGTDVSERLKALIVAVEGDHARTWGGDWDTPGRIPDWLRDEGEPGD